MFRMSCSCGTKTTVRASSAGVEFVCHSCGEKLMVPALSALRAHADRDEAAPAIQRVTASDDQLRIPEKFFSHFIGDVSSCGRVSPSAMENYVGVIVRQVDSFLESVDRSTGFQLLVSCALLPQHKKVVQVETAPAAAGRHWAQALQSLVENTTAPPIHDGPVGFVIYQRVNLNDGGQDAIRPFSDLSSQMEALGIDVALMRAAGLRLPTEEKQESKPSMWQRLRSVLIRSHSSVPPNSENSARESYDEMEAWLQNNDQFCADTTIAELRRHAVQKPDDITYHVGLAVKYAVAEQWTEAIGCYTTALRLEPDCSPLLGRRGQIHLFSGNRQAAMVDFNVAIASAPFEPWFYFQRSQIYADLGAWPEAEADLSSAHALAPRDPDFLLNRAEVRLGQGNHKNALSDLRQVLHLDPHSGRAHSQLGWIHQQDEFYDLNLAIEHLTRSIELIPDGIASLIHRALAYGSQNKFELALQDCDTVIQTQPDAGSAHGVRGRMLQMQGEFEEAIEACTKAIDLGLETSMVFLARGIAYSATDRQELALADCDAALNLDPENPVACQLRGTLDMQRGELDSAMEAFNKARELAPEWSEPRQHIAWLHQIKEDPQAAIDEQSVLVSQQPGDPTHYVNRAFAYTQLGDYEKAQQDLDRACQLDPENEQVFYVRGMFLMDRQEPELALRDFDRVLSIADNHDDARLRRAATLLYLKRQEEALKDYGKLIAKYPDDPQAYTGRAYTHQMTGNDDAADADFDRLKQIDPEHSHEMTIRSLHAKVNRLENQERYDEAIKVVEKIIEIAPDRALGYRLRALIRWYTEQYVEACDDYTLVLEMEPEQPGVLSSRGQVQAEMGEWRLALDDLDLAVQLCREAGFNQLLGFSLNGRALALAGLGRWDESTRDYEESVQLCPTNSWVYYNRGMMMFQQGDYHQAKQLLEMALNSEEPPLTKRKRVRAEVVLGRLSTETT